MSCSERPFIWPRIQHSGASRKRHAFLPFSSSSQRLGDFGICSTTVGNNYIHQITGQSWEGKILMPLNKSASLEMKYWLNTLEPQERPTWLHSEWLICPTPSGSKPSSTFWRTFPFPLKFFYLKKRKGQVAPIRQARCGRLHNESFEKYD
jgi:hypothetical protein